MVHILQNYIPGKSGEVTNDYSRILDNKKTRKSFPRKVIILEI